MKQNIPSTTRFVLILAAVSLVPFGSLPEAVGIPNNPAGLLTNTSSGGRLQKVAVDGFVPPSPSPQRMPNDRARLNTGQDSGNAGSVGLDSGVIGELLLNVLVQTLMGQLGLPIGGVASFMGGAPGSFTSAIMGRIGQDTSGIPGTDGGNLACAWVVNDIFRQITGGTITGMYGGGGNPLSVKDTMDAMFRNPQAFMQVSRDQAIASGRDFIIASNYSYGANGSHIGWGRGSTIWSNSSSSGSIQQNYDAYSWERNYGATRYFIPV